MEDSVRKAKEIAKISVDFILQDRDEQSHTASMSDPNLLENNLKTFADSEKVIRQVENWNVLNKGQHVEQFERKFNEKKRRKNVRSRLLVAMQYAAVIFLVIGAYFVINHQKRENFVTVDRLSSGYSLDRASLILNSGERITIKHNEPVSISSSSMVLLEKNSKEERIKIEQIKDEKKIEYHTLETPKGGGYTVELTDGSIVKLNADSRLRFPSSFSSGKRLVYLEGEAYFEVAHDKKHPFVVEVGNMSIEVLGTEFNVKAHNEDALVYTTLVRGSVKVGGTSTTSMLLSPNEQAVFSKLDASITKKEVDVTSTLGWTQGRFIFKNEPLEDILKQISRWYDVKIVYKDNKYRNYRFTGNVDRFEDLNKILSMLNKAYTVRLELQNNIIVVRGRG